MLGRPCPKAGDGQGWPDPPEVTHHLSVFSGKAGPPHLCTCCFPLLEFSLPGPQSPCRATSSFFTSARTLSCFGKPVLMPWLDQSVLLCPTAPLGSLPALLTMRTCQARRPASALLSGEEAGRPREKHKLESQVCLCCVTLGKSLNYVNAVLSSVKWGQ